jgi:hypothetical protein
MCELVTEQDYVHSAYNPSSAISALSLNPTLFRA